MESVALSCFSPLQSHPVCLSSHRHHAIYLQAMYNGGDGYTAHRTGGLGWESGGSPGEGSAAALLDRLGALGLEGRVDVAIGVPALAEHATEAFTKQARGRVHMLGHR
jgi:hypothetical protein